MPFCDTSRILCQNERGRIPDDAGEFNAKVIPFEIVGEERNRDKLPFQDMPIATRL